MTAPYDPTLMQDLRVEGIRYLRVSPRTWSFSPIYPCMTHGRWAIHVQKGGRSRQMIRVIRYRFGDTPKIERQIYLHTQESFAWTLALARNLNGNNDKPDPTRRG